MRGAATAAADDTSPELHKPAQHSRRHYEADTQERTRPHYPVRKNPGSNAANREADHEEEEHRKWQGAFVLVKGTKEGEERLKDDLGDYIEQQPEQKHAGLAL